MNKKGSHAEITALSIAIACLEDCVHIWLQHCKKKRKGKKDYSTSKYSNREKVRVLIPVSKKTGYGGRTENFILHTIQEAAALGTTVVLDCLVYQIQTVRHNLSLDKLLSDVVRNKRAMRMRGISSHRSTLKSFCSFGSLHG